MTHGKEGRSQVAEMEEMEVALRAALERLRLGMPQHARNCDLMAHAARLGRRRVLNVRMLCRESGLSPTTVYKRFHWVVAILQAEDAGAGPESKGPPSPGEIISQQAREITALIRALGIVRTELHQVAEANIALGERLEGSERARQAAVDAGRRRKEDSSDNVSRLPR